MKAKYWIILFIISILIVQSFAVAKILRDNRRLSDNFHAVITDFRQDSANTARTERLLLETSEIKSYFPEISENIKKLDIKMKQLERYSALGTASSYQISNKLRDTVRIKETMIQERLIRDTVKMQYISYQDKWLDFQQAIVADSAYTNIKTRDSIAIVQSWERPNKFWFVKWGRKRHIQTVTNANPHATITYSIFVEKQ